YSFGLCAIYSLISYKTPWCLIGFWSGMILVAGVGAGVIVRSLKPQLVRIAAALAIAGATIQLAAQAWQSGHQFASSAGNPYVYSPTSDDILKLVAKLEGISTAHQDGHGLLIKVMAPNDEYWPLPWYLRAFRNVGWWNQVPADPFAPMMIV